MKKYKNLIFYSSIMGFFSILIYSVLHARKDTPIQNKSFGEWIESCTVGWSDFRDNLSEIVSEALPILLLQIVVILLAVRLFGWVCQKIGQPTVIGEIFAGIVLGPSILGYYFPDTSTFLFPIASHENIRVLSQIGLILFMFIVGLELDMKAIQEKGRNATIISHVSIIIPFSFGVILASFLYELFPTSNTNFFAFALFMGIAMSIAAFPVMARIVHERGINKTPLGAVIITCAAIDDITAWCLLAGVIAIAKAGSVISSLFVIALACVYVAVMFKIVRPFLKQVADSETSKKNVSKSVMGLFFLVLFLSAYASEIIGIHALFGAFLAGVIMPSNVSFRNLFSEKIEDVALILLLPLFFVYTGLRTQIGLINEPHLWLICGGIILLAVIGKSMGSAFAARFVGHTWKDSLTIGALMNTRGLMELVVLNIGLDLGILSPEIFTMMVVMALTTTFMTSPLLNLIDKIFKKEENDSLRHQKYKILVSFEDSAMGKKLLFLANSFIRKRQSNSELTMLHLSEGNVLYQYAMEEEEEDIFKTVLEEANNLNQQVISSFNVTNNVHVSMVKIANKGKYDLLLIHQKESKLDGDVLGRVLGYSNKLMNIPNYIVAKLGIYERWSKTLNTSITENTRAILSKSDIPVGIFIDKGMGGIRNVFVPILSDEDIFVGSFMERLAANSYIRITVWDAIGLVEQSLDFANSVKAIKQVNPYLFQLWNNHIPIDSHILKKQDLMMISLHSWKIIEDKEEVWLPDVPSMLVLVDN